VLAGDLPLSTGGEWRTRRQQTSTHHEHAAVVPRDAVAAERGVRVRVREG
jgi:hypothetical protein